MVGFRSCLGFGVCFLQQKRTVWTFSTACPSDLRDPVQPNGASPCLVTKFETSV